MEQKRDGSNSAHIRSFFRIALLGQTVLGILFFVYSFSNIVMNESVRLWELSSITTIRDDHMGIVYPNLIQFAYGIQNHFFIPYYKIVYLIQLFFLAMTAFAISWMHGRKGERLRFFWAVLFCPPLCRGVLTISPAILKWLVYILLVSLVIWVLRHSGEERRKGICVTVFLVVCYAVILIIGKIGAIQGSYGQVHKSLASDLFLSVMESNTEEKLDYLESIYPDTANYRIYMKETTAEQVRGTFGAMVDGALGKEADAYFYGASFAIMKAYPCEVLCHYLQCGLALLFSTKGIGSLPLWIAFWGFYGVSTIGFLQNADITMKQSVWKNDWRKYGKIVALAGVLLMVVAAACFAGWKRIESRGMKTLSGRVIVLGDSIWGLVQDETGLASILEQRTSLQVDNYCVPGAAVCYDMDDVVNQKDSLEVWFSEEHLQETIRQIQPATADYVILAYGLNDYFAGNNTEEYKAVLMETIELLQAENPKLKFVLISPTMCVFYENGIMVSDGCIKDLGGGPLTAYSNAIREIAFDNDFLCIDMMQEMSYTRYDSEKYLLDGTHLTEYGRKRYGNIVAKQIYLAY